MMTCRNIANLSPLVRCWHRIWCAKCRAAGRADAILNRGIMGLKSALPPSDGLARTLAAVGAMPVAPAQHHNSRQNAAKRHWFMRTGAVSAATVVSLVGWLYLIDRDPGQPALMPKVQDPHVFKPFHQMFVLEAGHGKVDRSRPGASRKGHREPLLHRAVAESGDRTEGLDNEQRIGTAINISRNGNNTDLSAATHSIDNVSMDVAPLQVRDTQVIQNGISHILSPSLGNTRDLVLNPVSGKFRTLNLSIDPVALSQPGLASNVVARSIFNTTNFSRTLFGMQGYVTVFGPRRDDNNPTVFPQHEERMSAPIGGQSAAVTGTLPGFESLAFGSGDGLSSNNADRLSDRSVPLILRERSQLESSQRLTAKFNSIALVNVGDVMANASSWCSWWHPHRAGNFSTQRLLARYLNTCDSVLNKTECKLRRSATTGLHLGLVTRVWPLRLDDGCADDDDITKGRMTL